MHSLISLFILWATCSLVLAADDEPLFKAKFDYKQSFKRPFFVGANDPAPHFQASNAVQFTEEFARLTGTTINAKGSVWGRDANPYKEWEVHFSMRVTGHGVGGYGLSFWYSQKPQPLASTYGAGFKYPGFAVLFDSSDMFEGRQHPYIYGYQNKEGSDKERYKKDLMAEGLGSCFRDYRNSQKPVWVRITYFKKELHVYMDMNQDGQSYTECFAVKNIDLPAGYYFGIAASTEMHVFDTHDVLAFEVYEINPPEKAHKYRPYEKEHVKKEGEYHIDKKMQDKIKKIQEEVRDARVKHDASIYGDDSMNSVSISKILETQHRIIEVLDLILAKVELPKIDKKTGKVMSTQEVALGKKMEDLTTDVRQLVNVVNSLSHRVFNDDKHNMVMQTMNHQLNDIRNHLEVSKNHIIKSVNDRIGGAPGSSDSSSSSDDSSTPSHSTLYYLVAFSGGCVVMYAVSVLWRNRSSSSQPKKFV